MSNIKSALQKTLVLAAFSSLLSFANDPLLLALAQNTDPVEKTVEAATKAAEAPKTNPDAFSSVKDRTLRQHLMDNIDIFGKTDLSAIYILGPGLEEFEGQLLARDFSRDEFFMQNIDREEFEMGLYLRDPDLDEKKLKDEKPSDLR